MPSQASATFVILAILQFVAFSKCQEEIKYGPPCETPNGESGFCVALTECKTLAFLLVRSKQDPGNADYLRRSMCGGDNGTNMAFTEGFSIFESYTNITACCPVEDLRKDLDRKAKELLPSRAECGQQFVEGVLDDKITQLKEFPWIAQIWTREDINNETEFLCTGSLINQNHVLAIAWCLFLRNGVFVRLGVWNNSSPLDCSKEDDCVNPVVHIEIAEIFKHESSFKGPLVSLSGANDIAIIRLSQKVTYSDYIRPICLPPRDLADSYFDGMDLIAAGWGGKGWGKFDEVKMKVALIGASKEYCENIFKYLIKYNRRVHPGPGELCAVGIEGRATCSTDYGIQLMAYNDTDPNEKFWYLAGIHTDVITNTCGTEGVPSIFTKVNYYYDWVLTKLQ